ncbi:hypothetical protein [Sporichthya polymorpha]|uniref:hypothetical protein n=1 Tax=Sporichthya polymorpha TaxID=35751 RepID=UPI000A052B4F|nr:hypothetical protein [Sporichthya polymorpha]
MPRSPRFTVVAAGVLFLVAGCGDDEDSASQDPTPVVTAGVSPSDTPSVEPSRSETPSASADAEEGQTVEIDIVNGKPSEKIGTITVKKGEKLTLVVTSDAEHEVHIHAGDISFELPAGETVRKTVTIDAAAGSYEVELEDTGTLLFTLQVR